jgi:hypothetical protein
LFSADAAFDCKSGILNELDDAIDKLPTVSSCLDEGDEFKVGVMFVVSRRSSV